MFTALLLLSITGLWAVSTDSETDVINKRDGTSKEDNPPACCVPVATREWGDNGLVVATGAPVAVRARIFFVDWPGTSRANFKAGDSIKVAFRVRNDGVEPVTLHHAGLWPNHLVELVDHPGGSQTPLTEFGYQTRSSYSPRGERQKNAQFEVAPAAIDEGEANIDLTRLFDLSRPGLYSLRIRYEEDIRLNSNQLEFRIE